LSAECKCVKSLIRFPHKLLAAATLASPVCWSIPLWPRRHVHEEEHLAAGGVVLCKVLHVIAVTCYTRWLMHATHHTARTRVQLASAFQPHTHARFNTVTPHHPPHHPSSPSCARAAACGARAGAAGRRRRRREKCQWGHAEQRHAHTSKDKKHNDELMVGRQKSGLEAMRACANRGVVCDAALMHCCTCALHNSFHRCTHCATTPHTHAHTHHRVTRNYTAITRTRTSVRALHAPHSPAAPPPSASSPAPRHTPPPNHTSTRDHHACRHPYRNRCRDARASTAHLRQGR